jgi:uncharacterized protein YbjT (DUF2867 family)
MKILVTTPNGRIGRWIVPELLAPDFSVRVITRNPARMPPEIREQVEVVHGSPDDPRTLRHALEGVEALFWCVPTESCEETKVEYHYERFACAGWQAIREAATPRVVTISATGKGRAWHAGRICGLHAMEEILNESGAAIRHLRCGLFMENFLQNAEQMIQHGELSYPLPGHVPIPMVAAVDVADIALRFLVRSDWSGITGIPVHGPEDLSYGEAAATMGRVLGRSVRYEQASAGDYVLRLMSAGASWEYARSLAEMHAELGQGIAQAEPRTPEFSMRTTLAKWSASELVPVAQSLLAESAPDKYSPLLQLGEAWPPGVSSRRMQLGV